MPTITFPAANHHSLSPLVSIKQRWGDDWIPTIGLHCDDCVFASAPGIGSARLYWRYGVGILDPALSQKYGVLNPQRLNRWYVRVEWRRSPDVLEAALAGGPTSVDDPIAYTWYGTIETDEETMHGTLAYVDDLGADTVDITGEQSLYAFGLEFLLEQRLIDHSLFVENDKVKRVDRALTFNDRGRPNRSSFGTPHGGPVFAQAGEDKFFWRSYDIVRYLLETHTVKNGLDVAQIDLIFDDDELRSILPRWDQPVIEQHDARLWSLLNRLISSRRTIGFHLTVVPIVVGAINVIRLNPYTYTNQNLPLGLVKNVDDAGGVGGPASIPPNLPSLTITNDQDQSAQTTVKRSTVDVYDVVIVRGRRIRICGTWSFEDANMIESWTDDQRDQYNAGATTWPAYATAGLNKRRRLNDEARAVPELAEVYARFEILLPWDGLLGKGVQGSPGDLTPVFAQAGTAVPLYQCDLAILDTLPLIAGVDYSGDRITSDLTLLQSEEAANEVLGERPPLVAWRIGGTVPARYNDVTRIGDAADVAPVHAISVKWSAAVIVESGENGIWLRVSGEPRHAIAYADFVPIVGADRYVGVNNFRQASFTIAVHSDLYCEGVAKTGQVGVDADLDTLRRLILYAGDDYLQDYVAAHTIVGIDEDGVPLRTDVAGFIHDDSAILEGAAEAALGWYGQARHVLSMTTGQIVAGLSLGQMVGALQYTDPAFQPVLIQTVITELRLTAPQTMDSADVGITTMAIRTNEGQFDPIQR